MRILHCADLHLDAKMTSNFSKEKAKERKAELLFTFQQMVDYAADNGIGHLLIAGDLFDAKRVAAQARNRVEQAILRHSEICFYYLRGNHDTDSFLANLPSIPDNLYLFSDEWKCYELSEKVRLVGAEAPIYPALVLDNEKINIVTLHGQVGDQDEVPLRELRDKGIDYLALGHVHAHQIGKLDARGVYCYPGCMEGRGFDECGQHGFVIVDIDEETERVSYEFVPFAKREIHEKEVDITGCMTTDDAIDKIEYTLGEEPIAEKDILRIVLVGEIDVEAEITPEYLERKYEGRFYFFKVKNKTVRRVDYQAYALDASLKGEFIRTVMADEKMSDEDRAEVVRMGILALAGEEI